MLPLPQALQKDSQFKVQRIPASISPASLPFCRLLLGRIRTSIFHWQRFGTAWLKVLIDWPGFGESCKKHEDSMGNAARTYGGDGICHPQLLKVKLV